MVANQPTLWTTVSGLQALRSTSAPASNACLPTADFLGAGLAEQRFHLAGFLRARGHEDTEPIIRETRIVLNLPTAPRGEHGVEEDSQDRRQCAEENGHLEHDDDVGRHGSDWFPADDERPIVRHPQREPRTDGTARNTADQREHAHGTHGLIERVLDLVARDGRIDGEVRMPRRAQLLDGLERRVEVLENAEDARRGRRPKDVVERLGHHDHARTFAALLRGGGSTSFTSLMETAGKFLTNKRNHMKNHPKLPAMMPQSAHVGL